MVDLVITTEMSKGAMIELAHQATAVPSMISLYIIFGISLFFSGWGFKEQDTSWGRFFWIWSSTMALVFVFLIFFIYSPDSIQWLASKYEWIFS